VCTADRNTTTLQTGSLNLSLSNITKVLSLGMISKRTIGFRLLESVAARGSPKVLFHFFVDFVHSLERVYNESYDSLN